jgi:hypothetical protein
MGAFAHLFGMLQNRISGSGKFWRDRSEQSIAADAAKFDAIAIEPPPPGFKPEDLGDLLLIHFDDDDANIIVIRAAAPGNDMKWKGLPLWRSPMFKRLGFHYELDVQSFLHYVYNYKHVLFDVRSGEFWPAHPDDVDRIMFGEFSVPDMSLIRGALSR